jgi:hypothetical protein
LPELTLNVLKSRHYVTAAKALPNPSEKTEIVIAKDAMLTLGYSPGSVTLADLSDAFPSMPVIYLLKINKNATIDYNFVYSAGIASSSPSSFVPPDLPEPIGISGPQIDWVLIMLPNEFSLGQTIDLWFFLDQPASGRACPCAGSGECACDSTGKPGGCEFDPNLSALGGLVPSGLPSAYIKKTHTPSGDTGTTLHINITNTDIKSGVSLIPGASSLVASCHR